MEETSSGRLRWVTAILAAVCLVAGPVAATVVRVFSPAATTTESVAREIGDAAAHPEGTHAVLIANGFVWLMVPAALVAVSLAWRRAPALSLAAGVFSLAGWVGIVALATQDALIAQAGRHGYDHAQAVALTNAWSNGGVVNAYTTLFVIGHLRGDGPAWRGPLAGTGDPSLGGGRSSACRCRCTWRRSWRRSNALDIAAYALLLAGFGAVRRAGAARGGAAGPLAASRWRGRQRSRARRSRARAARQWPR